LYSLMISGWRTGLIRFQREALGGVGIVGSSG
jgi:hypothetical protein